MNEPVRRLSVVILVMFLVLMAGASYIQVITANDLNADGRNVRTLYREFGSFRGPFVVDGETVVKSVPVDDPFNYQRTYADGPLYAAATGYYSIVYGRSGLEQTENTLLNGSDDALFWNRLGDLFAGREQEGASVSITLDSTLQQVATEQLGDQRGAVVALDPTTGAILAMVTSPTYDPAALAGHNTEQVNENYQELLNDPTGPLVNRAIAGDTYPPGSVFKLVVSAAALESGYKPDTEVYAPQELDLPGTSATMTNYGGEKCTSGDTMTLADALRVSCNTAYANLGMSLGWGVIERKAKEFGWTDQIDIPLRAAASNLPVDPNEAQTAMASIGQYDDRATPLQMAMVASAIANQGTLLNPYLVDTVRAPDLSVIQKTEPTEYGQPMTRADASKLRDMMVGVVDNGTGTRAQIPGVKVAGKTGTAETGTDAPPHTWFVGFAPADKPTIAIAVLVENGGDLGAAGKDPTGGVVAAPIAKAVMEAKLAEDGDL
ncbi:peptidoglycan D,D-transpeptidase FtsI family protein [Demequina oxidasica]|uniref:peptidoglycan D,D-transpeptidase FtsI family protein n=1 Tax=Demequina oxidasica TaxID=676199 RepID=UPI000785B0AA|nr:penicillin-binding transpeptidase domain-containing protein [Demequina oxidasica]